MIKFFRKIRQSLLTENPTGDRAGKLTKYLAYAIGEILLVVIGILIALQVNNANETYKSSKELDKVYQNLIQEFESNQFALKVGQDQVKRTKKGSLELLSMMGRADEFQDKTDIDSLIEISLFWPTWKPSNFVLNELRNSGKLSLLKNTKIINLLFEWERRIEFVNDWNARMEKSSQEIVDFIKENGSLRNVNHTRISIPGSSFKTSNIVLFENIKFENQIDEKVVYTQFLQREYEKTNHLIDQILDESRKK